MARSIVVADNVRNPLSHKPAADRLRRVGDAVLAASRSARHAGGAGQLARRDTCVPAAVLSGKPSIPQPRPACRLTAEPGPCAGAEPDREGVPRRATSHRAALGRSRRRPRVANPLRRVRVDRRAGRGLVHQEDARADGRDVAAGRRGGVVCILKPSRLFSGATAHALFLLPGA